MPPSQGPSGETEVPPFPSWNRGSEQVSHWPQMPQPSRVRLRLNPKQVAGGSHLSRAEAANLLVRVCSCLGYHGVPANPGTASPAILEPGDPHHHPPQSCLAHHGLWSIPSSLRACSRLAMVSWRQQSKQGVRWRQSKWRVSLGSPREATAL